MSSNPTYRPGPFRGQVPAEEFDRFLEWHAKTFGGKPPERSAPDEPRETEPPEPDAKQRAAGDVE